MTTAEKRKESQQRSKMLSKVFCILLLGISATRTAAQCNACYDGSAPDSTKAGCQGIIDAAASLDAGSAQCSATQLEAYQRRCCRSAPGICTVCPDGAGFVAETVVPNPTPGGADITCADMNEELKFLDFVETPGVCSDTLLQRSATWCGCPNTSRQCTLCGDGSAPTKMNRVEKVLYNWDCSKSCSLERVRLSSTESQIVSSFQISLNLFLQCSQLMSAPS